MDYLDGLLIGYVAIETTQGGAAQTEAGDFESAGAEDDFFEWIHVFPILLRYSVKGVEKSEYKLSFRTEKACAFTGGMLDAMSGIT